MFPFEFEVFIIKFVIGFTLLYGLS